MKKAVQVPSFRNRKKKRKSQETVEGSSSTKNNTHTQSDLIFKKRVSVFVLFSTLCR
jgi:hypothetical protein